MQQVMTVGGYSVRSIGNYVREMRFIFEYYPDVSPADLTAEQIEVYICYIKKTFNSGFSKCRLVASSVSFFFKQILKQPLRSSFKTLSTQRISVAKRNEY
ncbi:MAG: phage integrase N-terminal SAM-like domain-containing protein [Segetibacter sp.]